MAFNVEKVANDLVRWLNDWFLENGPGCNAVIGISGGKDSSVTAALCVRALGADRVIGVLMPNGEQYDINVSEALVKHLGIRSYVVNIKDAYDGVVNAAKAAGVELSNQSYINLAPRIRMSTLYAVSQSYNGRVINTCNLSEDWVGYSTRYGDSVGDVCPPPTERKIAQMEDRTVLRDRLIPVLDQSFIHFFDRRKRPVAELDNPFMEEMGV